MSLQDECNAILDNESIFEDDRIDQVQDLVNKTFQGLSQKELEKKVMDILWKHKDPSRKENTSKVVRIEERQQNINIEEIERKIELESQTNKLDHVKDIDKEYDEIVQKIQDLKFQIYGDRFKKREVLSAPIDKISDIFNGAIPKSRIEQSLRVSGYNVIEASRYIINQLKRDRDIENQKPQTQLFSLTSNIPKAKTCSFFARNGKCLRVDCPFSHDLEQKVCHFWLKGNCLAGDNCTFKHSLDGLATELTISNTAPSSAAGSSSVPTGSVSSPVSSSGTTGPTDKPETKYKFSDIPVYTPSAPILIQKPLRRPKILPWDDKTIPNFKRYIELRNSAIRNEAQRKKFAEQSTKEWKANNGGKSKTLSDKANKFENKELDDLKNADDELFEYSECTKDEIWFEMHGLEYNEAIEQLASNLQVARTSAKGKLAYLVVPSVSDFQGFKKITKPLQIYLDQEGYRWEIFNFNSSYGSIIVIDPN